MAVKGGKNLGQKVARLNDSAGKKYLLKSTILKKFM